MPTEQLALFLHRYAEYKEYDTEVDEEHLHLYEDEHEVSEKALEAVNWAIAHGLLYDDGDGNLEPKDDATRAEAAHAIMNFMRKHR